MKCAESGLPQAAVQHLPPAAMPAASANIFGIGRAAPIDALQCIRLASS